jgi:DNA-directed RNA polymerase subunit RPC12/RpoP
MREEDQIDAQLHSGDKDTALNSAGKEDAEKAAESKVEAGADSGDKQSPGWESDSIQYVCNSCGAAVITDQNTAATFCAFCGSPTIIAERLVQERTPEYVLPFQYGREAAINGFFEWCKAGRFTPVQFVKKDNVEKMTGMYVPFWLFDSEAEMNISAEGKKITSSTTGRSTYTTTSYYNVVRKRHIEWDKIPLDGATRIEDKLMEIVEPYSYDDLKPFDMRYLAGFFADKYDVPADKLTDRLNKRVQKYIDTIFDDSIKSYNTVSQKMDQTCICEPKFHYALMPVWILNYKYLGKTYTFAMNGQTGKIAGEPPVSWVKLLVLGMFILPLAACVCRLIGMLILGGFLA